MKLAVRVESLRKDYVLGAETVRALRGVSIEVPASDYIAIMGPSGSGKSTLLNLLGCLDRPTAGRYLLDGSDVSKMGDDQLSDLGGIVAIRPWGHLQIRHIQRGGALGGGRIRR